MARPLSDEASLWLIELTVIYSVAALAALTAYGNASVLMQGRCGSAVQALQVRREASAERFYRSSCARCLGLTARHGQALGSLAYMTTVVVPCLLYTATLLGGAMIALAEGWRFQDGFMYIWQDVFSLGPYVSLQPEGVFGIVLDHYVSLVVFVITQIVLGFCGGLQIVGVVQEATSKSVSGFVRIVFLYSPISMAFVCVLSSSGFDMVGRLGPSGLNGLRCRNTLQCSGWSQRRESSKRQLFVLVLSVHWHNYGRFWDRYPGGRMPPCRGRVCHARK